MSHYSKLCSIFQLPLWPIQPFVIIPILIAFAVESNPGEEWSPTNRSTSADGDSVQRNSTALQIAENPHEPSRKMRLAHLDYPNNLNKAATTNISPICTGLWLSSLTDTAKVEIYPCVYIFCLCQCPCDAPWRGDVRPAGVRHPNWRRIFISDSSLGQGHLLRFDEGLNPLV